LSITEDDDDDDNDNDDEGWICIKSIKIERLKEESSHHISYHIIESYTNTTTRMHHTMDRNKLSRLQSINQSIKCQPRI